MKVSEYIEMLSELYEAHGDLDCEDTNEFPIRPPEFCQELLDKPPVFLLAEMA